MLIYLKILILGHMNNINQNIEPEKKLVNYRSSDIISLLKTKDFSFDKKW